MKIQDYAFIAIVLIVAILVLRGCDDNINHHEAFGAGGSATTKKED